MSDLKDKVILVTGSSAGIGEGIALHLAKLGCKLTLTGRNEENLKKVVEQCILLGLEESKVVYTVGDIKSPEVRENLIKKTLETFGRIDVLVNNAGLGYATNALNTTEEQYDETLNVNLKAVFFLTQLAIPHLKETKGNIINISSIAGSIAYPTAYVYAMGKSALDMYTKCLSVDLGPCGVRVNTISPGHVYSMIARRGTFDEKKYVEVMDSLAKRVPVKRIGNPEDIAKAVAFLASNEQASYVSGDIMYIDGAIRHMASGNLNDDELKRNDN